METELDSDPRSENNLSPDTRELKIFGSGFRECKQSEATYWELIRIKEVQKKFGSGSYRFIFSFLNSLIVPTS